MKQKWNRTVCALITIMLLCSFALPAFAEKDITLNALSKYAKVLQGKGSAFKDGLPEVFMGKAVIAVYEDLNSDPIELSTKSLAEDGDFWLIPSEFLASNIKEANWVLLVYGLEDGLSDSPLSVYCFAVDIHKGVYYAPYEIYSRDTYIGNDENTYELSGTLSGIDESVLYQAWKAKNGEMDEEEEESGSEPESEYDEAYLRGLEFLKEEKYYSAYEAFNESWSDGAYEQAQKCIKAWPKTGEVWHTSQGKGEKLEFIIKMNQSSSQATLLRFYRKGYPISYVFIAGSADVKITLPAGVYTIKSGEGSEWYGIKESFGRYGSYETMTFDGKQEIKLQAGHEYTMTINTSDKNPDADDVGSQYESWEGFSK